MGKVVLKSERHENWLAIEDEWGVKTEKCDKQGQWLRKLDRINLGEANAQDFLRPVEKSKEGGMWHLRDSVGSLLASEALVCPGRKKADNKNTRSTPSTDRENDLAQVWEAGEHTAEQLSLTLTSKCVQCGQLMAEEGHRLVCGFHSSKAPVPPGTVPDLAHCLSPFKLLVTWKLLITWYKPIIFLKYCVYPFF